MHEKRSSRAPWHASRQARTILRSHGAAIGILPFALGGCTFLIDVDTGQCRRDADCVTAGLGQSCEDEVCVGTEVADAGPVSRRSDPDSGAMRQEEAGPTTSDGTCRDDADCNASREEGCLGGECVDAEMAELWVCPKEKPEIDEDATLTYRVQVAEFVSPDPIRNLKVQACNINDITCPSPVAEFVDEAGTGLVELRLPGGFAGFLELTGDDMLTSLWYFTRPLTRDTVGKDLLVASPTTLSLLAGATGLAVDSSRGLVILEAFDCAEVGQGGVSFQESKGNALPFFIVNEIPNREVNVTVRDDVNDIAIGGFFNAAPGFTNFSARLGVDGPLLAEFNANVRPSTVTYVDLHVR